MVTWITSAPCLVMLVLMPSHLVAPTYFVPAALLPQIELCRDAMSALDATNVQTDEGEGGGGSGGRKISLIQMKLVPVRPGDEMQLKGVRYGSKTSFFVRALEVDHAGHPSLGYVIGSRTASGLKEEYGKLDGASIRDLVKSGVSIVDDPVERIEVAYSGDTCARGLTKRTENGVRERSSGGETKTTNRKPSFDVGQMFRAELLLCELTFLDPSEDEIQMKKASERGHLHINDLEGIFSSHDEFRGGGVVSANPNDSIGDGESGTTPGARPHPRSIVFYHLSARYQPAGRALDFIAEGLPRRLRDRCHVAVSSMLSREEKIGANNSLATLIQPNGCISVSDYILSNNDRENRIQS